MEYGWEKAGIFLFANSIKIEQGNVAPTKLRQPYYNILRHYYTDINFRM